MAQFRLLSMISLCCLLYSIAAQDDGSAVIPPVVTDVEYEVTEGTCTHTCGGQGTQIVGPRCVRRREDGEMTEVDDELCRSAGLHRPPARRVACNREDCPARWVVGDPGPCSSTCKGEQSVNTLCKRVLANGATVDVDYESCEFEDPSIRPPSTRTCGMECVEYEWVYGEYGECSSDCGPGTQTRTYYCRRISSSGNVETVRNAACINRGLGDPDTTQQCDPPNDCYLNISRWSACSATCDLGQQTRTVTCYKRRSNREGAVIVPLTECAKDASLVQAVTERQCFQECPCEIPRWDVLSYSPCPVSCGGNAYQTRSVFCTCTLYGRTQVTVDSACEAEKESKPASRRPCGQSPCPCVGHHWQKGSYGPCSLTCGEVGTRERKVECNCYLNGERQVANETRCNQRSKPVSKRNCYPPVCACKDPEWVYGPYAACSKQCNGIQTRDVRCQCGSDNRTLNDVECRGAGSRPPAIQSCNDGCECRNYDYSIGDWSYCSVSCGEGEQSRNVKCYCEKENVYEDVKNKTLCAEKTMIPYPEEKRQCSIPCPCTYQYVAGPWSPCDPDDCIGNRFRNLTCECHGVGCRCDGNRTGIEYCDSQHSWRPTENELCNECSYQWVPRIWSQCRRDCTRTRVISCYNVVTGERAPKSYCYAHGGSRPLDAEECQYSGPPVDKGIWEVSAWTPCSKPCTVPGMPGVKVRTVTCVNKCERVKSSNCSQWTRPQHRMQCNDFECDNTECVDKKGWPCTWARNANLCRDPVWVNRCCKTCSRGQ